MPPSEDIPWAINHFQLGITIAGHQPLFGDEISATIRAPYHVFANYRISALKGLPQVRIYPTIVSLEYIYIIIIRVSVENLVGLGFL